MKFQENKIVGYAILSIWAMIGLFALISYIQPTWLQRLSEHGKNVEGSTLKNYGDQFLKDGKYKEAIYQYTKALEIVPEMKGALANLGIAYQNINQPKEAIDVYKQLLKMKPEFPDVIYVNIGEIYESYGDFDKAVKYYLMAAEVAAFPQSKYQKAGVLLMNQERYYEAIDCFIQAVDHKKTLKNDYKSMLVHTRQVYHDTTDHYQKLSQYLQTNSFLNDLEKYDHSIYKDLLNQDIDLAKTYNNIGYCYAILEEYDQSKPYLERALEIHPHFKNAQNNLKIVNGFLKKNE